MNPTDYKVNLHRSGTDVRDYVFQRPDGLAVPTSIDNQGDFDIAPFDQGAEGSCTAQALAAAFMAMQKVDGIQEFMPPSQRFAYAVGRMIENTFPYDSGCTIRDIVAGCVKNGICSFLDMPYIPGQISLAPTAIQYARALPNKPSAYRSVPQDLASLEACIALHKPVLFGFPVYTGGFDATGPDGIVPPPSGSLRGYHANLLMGYDPTYGKSRNSWGTGFGKGGYCYFRWADLLNPKFAFDFWVLDSVVGPVPPTPPPPPGPPTEAQLWAALEKMHVSGTDPISLEYIETNDIGQWRCLVKYGVDRHNSNPPEVIAVDIP